VFSATRHPSTLRLPPSTYHLFRASGLRLIDLADASGLSIGHVRRCLLGERPCSPELLSALVRLGVVDRAAATARDILAVVGAE
jgi:hypothetical protein